MIRVSEAQRAGFPEDLAGYPKLMVCETPEELEAALEGGFEAWSEFRNRACAARSQDGPASSTG